MSTNSAEHQRQRAPDRASTATGHRRPRTATARAGRARRRTRPRMPGGARRRGGARPRSAPAPSSAPRSSRARCCWQKPPVKASDTAAISAAEERRAERTSGPSVRRPRSPGRAGTQRRNTIATAITAPARATTSHRSGAALPNRAKTVVKMTVSGFHVGPPVVWRLRVDDLAAPHEPRPRVVARGRGDQQRDGAEQQARPPASSDVQPRAAGKGEGRYAGPAGHPRPAQSARERTRGDLWLCRARTAQYGATE